MRDAGPNLWQTHSDIVYALVEPELRTRRYIIPAGAIVRTTRPVRAAFLDPSISPEVRAAAYRADGDVPPIRLRLAAAWSRILRRLRKQTHVVPP